MAIKARITFFAYNDGREVNAINGTTMVNSYDEAEQRMKEFAQKHHPEAGDVTVLVNQKSETIGAWLVFARSNIDADFYFTFIINKL